jgi:hypothetical protein
MKQFSVFLATLFLTFSAQAALLDLTDSSTTPSGFIDGVGYTLSSNIGTLNSNENYDGTLSTGCSFLACEKDGIGISNDEVDAKEILTLTFDSKVKVSALYFLDVYTSSIGTEKVVISFDGIEYGTAVFGTEYHPEGGFASLDGLYIMTQVIDFTAPLGFNDDKNNDFALAGVEVSSIPVPAAAFLFVPAMLGMIGLRRKVAQTY